MARGGFISASVALNRVYKCVGSRTEAQRMIADGLMVGEVRARGRRQEEAPPLEECNDGPLEDACWLEDINDTELVLGEIEEIPGFFWTRLTDKDLSRWDWHDGILFNNNSGSDEVLYEKVDFNEKDINALIKKQQSRGMVAEAEPRAERKRHPSWDDWVAAVTILALENQIEATMKQRDLLDRVNAKLHSWDLEAKENTTVAPTARKILERLRSNPPVAPLDFARSGGKKP